MTEGSELNLPTIDIRPSGFVGEQWTYIPKVSRYYPTNYITQSMFDMTILGYDDNAISKSFYHHMESLLPNVDNSISVPQNIFKQPLYKGLGYLIEYDSDVSLPKFNQFSGWWSDNLQNRDDTLLAGQTLSNIISIDKSNVLPEYLWIGIRNLNNPLYDVVSERIKNMYVCLYNQNRVLLQITNGIYSYLSNVVQNNIVPIITDMSNYNANTWTGGCIGINQYSPLNISKVNNKVTTPNVRDWMFFALNLRGNAFETINIPLKMTSVNSNLEGTIKIAEGGNLQYWYPSNRNILE